MRQIYGWQGLVIRVGSYYYHVAMTNGVINMEFEVIHISEEGARRMKEAEAQLYTFAGMEAPADLGGQEAPSAGPDIIRPTQGVLL